jgi:Xaa-Pro dipeptidase
MDLVSLHRAHAAEIARGVGRALENAGFTALVVHSGSLVKRTAADDQYWPLRPTPHFQHWLPLAEPGCLLVVEPGKRPVLVRPRSQSFWEAPAAPESDHFWSAFEVVEAMPHLPPGRAAFVGDDLAAAATLGIADVNPPALVQALDALRVRKTPYEVACLAVANRRAARGHDELRRLFQGADRSELELHLAFLGATRQDDAETPYKNIVALGHHAATLHHVGYGRRSERALSLLLDAGARYQGYDSDITRTAVKGTTAAATVFADLVARLEKLQQEICGRVKVGVPYEQLHNQTHELLAVELCALGVGTASPDELVASGVTRKLLPHGLGHSLGIQTHDVGCAVIRPEPRNPHLRNTSTIAAGQVFTIEPGCYFIDGLLQDVRHGPHRGLLDWRLVDELAPFGGVRIEDDLVVLDEGTDNLTRAHLPT